MAIKYYGAPNETAPAQYARDRRTREEKLPYGPFASFFWPGLMRLDGEGATPELFPFPAGCAASVLPGFGTPALVPGMDEPRSAPLVDEPVVVAPAGEPVAEPPPDGLFCARASVPVSANALAKAKVESFIAIPFVCFALVNKPRNEFKFPPPRPCRLEASGLAVAFAVRRCRVPRGGPWRRAPPFPKRPACRTSRRDNPTQRS